ncbi:unnamed protein product [Chironomus riparius]|uniref:Beta-hexosaminidase n=1 Tax=Chironomus riparius TaxID=315576 RepID=A0A9N9WTZ0_9DIPT|nr:unnamed protein product [Chironomus riparius]
MAVSQRCCIIVGVAVVIAAMIIGVVVFFLVRDNGDNCDDENIKEYDGPTWGYICEDFLCKRIENTLDNMNETTSFNVCRLTCGEDIGTLWPVPSGRVSNSRRYLPIDMNRFTPRVAQVLNSSIYFDIAWSRFQDMQMKKAKDSESPMIGEPLLVVMHADTNDMSFTYDTDESYTLETVRTIGAVFVNIVAKNFYGVRHALETLSQLIVYDEFENELVILCPVKISDGPKFPHRGISFDTSRNFYPISAIKRTIEGLAMVKLNTFHWHITDSQSFPFVLKSYPEITKLGAYSPDRVYSHEDIKEVVEFGKSRGVRVIPEFDTPAHVGEGWQNTGLVICYKDPSMEAQWRGHFDPTKDELYDVLENIYKEFVDAFNPPMFHIGADEVGIDCWNTSTTIKEWMTTRGMEHTKEGFMELWEYYLENSVQRLEKSFGNTVPIILWTSSLTQEPYLTKHLDKDRYIVQVWLYKNDTEIKALLENGYKLILSNSDALYLDCGVGGWVNDGLNWCSPYNTWQTLYQNKIDEIAGEYVNQVYGAEVAIWSESIDSTIIDLRVWPRTSAFAERMWSDPQTHWKMAEPRLLINRERLVKIGGIAAEMLQPEWCLQQEGLCPFP